MPAFATPIIASLLRLVVSVVLGGVEGVHHGQLARKIRDEFDVLYAEGAEHGRVMNIAVHPFIMGQPHRIDALGDALEYIRSHDQVWWATGAQIVQWYRQHHLEETV